jgi:hypothetical protein
MRGKCLRGLVELVGIELFIRVDKA